MQVELPQKYEVMLLSEKLIIIDEETKDFAEVALNPLRVERNFLRNQRVVNKVVRALSIFQAYKTPSLQSFL
jgi:hypothetical protein